MLRLRHANPPGLWSPTSLLTAATRQQTTIGGRHSRVGSNAPLGKHPQVKQGPALGVPRRVPGTTKVRYTNEKGRTFSFSIPVGQLTHPPTVREAAAPGGWREMDTSYCDTGEVEEDMPSPVSDVLRRYTVTAGVDATVEDGADEGDVYLKLDETGLQELQAAYVAFCRQYVLMDTQGMKTSLSYGELNTGPDYEMQDRKLMRKRYWLSIRHRYEDLREVLWPSSVLACSGTDTGTDAEEPTLTATAMLEALVWLEAASTFCVRSHRPYDIVGAEEFLPLDLSREVRVLAQRVRTTLGAAFFTEAPGAAADSRAASDRLLSCAALCAAHRVPFASFFPHDVLGGSSDSVHAVLAALPPLHKPKDAVRVMSVLVTMADASGAPRPYAFSNPSTGEVVDIATLTAISTLCGGPVFADSDALANVGESELSALLQFIVRVREQNVAFFSQANSGGETDVARARVTLNTFTSLALARCRYLLYRLGGPQTGIVSGDEDYVPLVELQRNSEGTRAEALVHYKIGMENAMGMRFVRLRAKSSATLLELLHRLEATGECTRVHTLVTDLVQHVAHKVAVGGERLSLDDIARVLPLLAGLLDAKHAGCAGAAGPVLKLTSGRQPGRYERLLSAISTAIGAEMASAGSRTAEEITAVLEGLAQCRYVPSSLPQLEMVLLRVALRGHTPLPTMERALRAMAQLVGPTAVSQAVQQAAAAMVVEAFESSRSGAPPPEALGLARMLYRCHYGAYASMIETAVEVSGGGGADAATDPAVLGSWAVALAFAAAALPNDDGRCAKLSAAARAAMTAFLAAIEPVGPGAAVNPPALEVDLYYDVLTSCAALGVSVPMSGVERMEGALYKDSPAAELTTSFPLHHLQTPLLAMGTLESLEALQLVDTHAYRANAAYVERVLAALQTTVEGGAPLLPDDAEVVVRALQLTHAPPQLRGLAAPVLEVEVMRLDAVLEGATEASGTSVAPKSFEQHSLASRERAAVMQERLLRYCAALQRGQVAATS